MKIYASWSENLAYNEGAMAHLKNFVDGIELWNTDDDQADRIRRAGLDVCMHTPGGMSNLMDPAFREAFENDGRLLEVIRASECPVVSFHCGYSATRIEKDYRIHQIKITGEPITDRKALLNGMVDSLLFAKERINDSGKADKIIAVECLPHHREDAEINRMDNSPVNTGKEFVTEPDFMEELIERANVWFLKDLAHELITGDTREYNKRWSLRGDSYTKYMLFWVGRIRGLHVSRPYGGNGTPYVDKHMLLIEGDAVSEKILDHAAMAIEFNPDIYFSTLEMDTGKGPMEHARIMAEQAELYRRGLMKRGVKI